MSTLGKLLLLPLPLGEIDTASALPSASIDAVVNLRRFIAEDARTARRFLKQLPLARPIQEIVFDTLNEHTPEQDLDSLLAPLLHGEDVGLVSEAGCPGVADPGAALIALAHDKGIPVAPLVGPSAILLALMASGLNGQRFRFNGYLPVESAARIAAIKALEASSRDAHQTEIFIETPYRNDALLSALIDHCDATTRIAIASDLTTATQEIVTRSVAAWRAVARPNLAKRPTVFSVEAQQRVTVASHHRSRSS